MENSEIGTKGLERPSEITTFLFGGRCISAEDASAFPVLASGPDLTPPNTTIAFSSMESFARWGRTTKYAESIQETLLQISKVQERERDKASVERIQARQKLIVERYAQDLLELAKHMELEVGSMELFEAASSKADPLQLPIFDPVGLSDTTDPWKWTIPFRDWLPLGGGWWPDLGWFGWNDRAVSGRVSGLAAFCEHTWFRGRWLWLAGFPVWPYQFGWWGFSRIISSAIIL